MPTEVTSKTLDSAMVIYLDGDLTTTSSPEVGDKITELLSERLMCVIINVERVGFIASTGLRIFLALGKQLSAVDLELSVCSMNETTKSVFDVSGFSKLFPTFETEEEALGSLS